MACNAAFMTSRKYDMTGCTYNVLEAKLCQYRMILKVREHYCHLTISESSPVGVDEICHDDSNF